MCNNNNINILFIRGDGEVGGGGRSERPGGDIAMDEVRLD